MLGLLQEDEGRTGGHRMTLWLKVSRDQYEHPLIIADSAQELAEMSGIKLESLYSTISHRKQDGKFCPYRRVDIEED